jgi:hypothetical protein
MPLIKSGSRAAVSQNIAEMRQAGHPQAQAVAAALSNARKYGAKMQAGGGGFQAPLGERIAARNLIRQGFLHSAVPGRTDKLPITVGGGAYVLPADHLAAIGQGNSLAGAHIVNKMFGMGPFGTQRQNITMGHATPGHLNLSAKPGHLAAGGSFHEGKPTPIVAAGGEMVIPPDRIIAKFGDLDKGHKMLDQWVVNTRKTHIKTLRHLKPPKKD